MNFITKGDVPHLQKPEGVSDYYMFNDYEVLYFEQQPHTTQVWHHHDIIWETIYIIDGELTAHWHEEDGKKQKRVLKPGDLVETERSPHTFSNDTNNVARFMGFKHMPDNTDYSRTFKTDKVLD